jgi:hypothetical protein
VESIKGSKQTPQTSIVRENQPLPLAIMGVSLINQVASKRIHNNIPAHNFGSEYFLNKKFPYQSRRKVIQNVQGNPCPM